MGNRSIFVVGILASIALAINAGAQVVEGPSGPIEFVGLKEWSAPELFKALTDLEPDMPFHACAVPMKRDLGFADAAALGYTKIQEDGTRSSYTVVVGVEDDSGVQYRTLGSESIDLPDSWKELQSVVEGNATTLRASMKARFLVLADPVATQTFAEQQNVSKSAVPALLAKQLGAKSEYVDEVLTLLEATKEENDFQLALDVLARDASWSARAVATVVLGHFPENEASWHSAAASLVDPHGRVHDVAYVVLDGLVRTNEDRPIRWIKARESLTALFGGTNPFGFNDILKTLVATEVDAEFGLRLLHDEPDLLLAFAGAEHEEFSKPAQDFLRTISGEDFGNDIKAWTEWVKESETVP